DVVLLKPQTFVTLIGESVLYIASFLRINVKDIICIVEDSSLDLGELRIDYLQSDLNHAGVDSMAVALKSEKFAKVRVGVGECPEGTSMEDYLLQDFTFEENLLLIDILNKAEQAVRMLVTNNIEEVQEKYNPEGAPKIKKRQVKAIHIDHRKSQKNS
ncbi:MAG TPA: aminoacyl-tRNA hydrolase, partial [Spirochaetota bacterium]|nr:aminoacyl-tRNA hydrolase [Spirochaetota bacterium]